MKENKIKYMSFSELEKFDEKARKDSIMVFILSIISFFVSEEAGLYVLCLFLFINQTRLFIKLEKIVRKL